MEGDYFSFIQCTVEADIRSSLDIFGGSLVVFEELVAHNKL
jgi:hypothetical protein